MPNLSRRGFLKVAATGAAATLLAGCIPGDDSKPDTGSLFPNLESLIQPKTLDNQAEILAQSSAEELLKYSNLSPAQRTLLLAGSRAQYDTLGVIHQVPKWVMNSTNTTTTQLFQDQDFGSRFPTEGPVQVENLLPKLNRGQMETGQLAGYTKANWGYLVIVDEKATDLGRPLYIKAIESGTQPASGLYNAYETYLKLYGEGGLLFDPMLAENIRYTPGSVKFDGVLHDTLEVPKIGKVTLEDFLSKNNFPTQVKNEIVRAYLQTVYEINARGIYLPDPNLKNMMVDYPENFDLTLLNDPTRIAETIPQLKFKPIDLDTPMMKGTRVDPYQPVLFRLQYMDIWNRLAKRQSTHGFDLPSEDVNQWILENRKFNPGFQRVSGEPQFKGFNVDLDGRPYRVLIDTETIATAGENRWGEIAAQIESQLKNADPFNDLNIVEVQLPGGRRTSVFVERFLGNIASAERIPNLTLSVTSALNRYALQPMMLLGIFDQLKSASSVMRGDLPGFALASLSEEDLPKQSAVHESGQEITFRLNLEEVYESSIRLRIDGIEALKNLVRGGAVEYASQSFPAEPYRTNYSLASVGALLGEPDPVKLKSEILALSASENGVVSQQELMQIIESLEPELSTAPVITKLTPVMLESPWGFNPMYGDTDLYFVTDPKEQVMKLYKVNGDTYDWLITYDVANGFIENSENFSQTSATLLSQIPAEIGSTLATQAANHGRQFDPNFKLEIDDEFGILSLTGKPIQ